VAPYPVDVIRRWAAVVAAAGAAMLLAAGCAGPGARPPAAAPKAAEKGTRVPSAGPAAAGHPHHAAARRKPARRRNALPRFTADVSGPLSRRDLPYSWHPGCPVGPGQLRAIHLSYVGFDGRAHR